MKSFPIFHQHDGMQCGIACLQMICRYFGREYSLDSLSKLCFATTEGVSMLGINETAKTLGLDTVCAKTSVVECGQCPVAGVAVPYPIHRGCWYQEPRYWIHLAHSLRPVDAHRQPNCDRLRPPMVPAPIITW